jgi:hypothetical protein
MTRLYVDDHKPAIGNWQLAIAFHAMLRKTLGFRG